MVTSGRVRAASEWAELRTSRIHGTGLFARKDIPKGARVIEYRGPKVGKKESERRVEEQTRRGRIYIFTLNQRVDVDGSVAWNLARYANHSCDPNCETDIIRGRIWVLARRDIPAGEELTYDYNFGVDEALQTCRCGAPECLGYIVGSGNVRSLARALRKRGLPLPPGLRRRLRAADRRRAARRRAAASSR